MMVRTLFALLVLAATGSATAQTPLEKRLEEVKILFSPNPTGVEAMFSESFLAQVPATQISALFVRFDSQYGKIVSVRSIEEPTSFAGKYKLTLANGYQMPMNLSVEPAAPHKIIGLWFGMPSKLIASLEGIVEEFRRLPGTTSLLITKGNGKTALVSHNADKWLAMGSAFKLHILEELQVQVATKQKRWEDVVRLTERSLPSGKMQDWPLGSPVTLHTLATMMISISDNTATDQLIDVVGRDDLDARQLSIKHPDAARNIPFLKTREMFRLKSSKQFRDRYLRSNTQERRSLLDSDISGIELDDLPISESPMDIDSLEWFASAERLSETMLSIKARAAENLEASRALEILAVNPGLRLDTKQWKYIGYKGGSEPGVLNMTFLLESMAGEWYTAVATWNDSKAPLKDDEFMSLLQRAIELIR